MRVLLSSSRLVASVCDSSSSDDALLRSTKALADADMVLVAAWPNTDTGNRVMTASRVLMGIFLVGSRVIFVHHCLCWVTSVMIAMFGGRITRRFERKKDDKKLDAFLAIVPNA